MPTLVVRHPDGKETEHALTGELTIGRQEGCELVLTAGGVSRRHARVFVEGSQVMVEDLGSANGTYIDGERIAEPTPLGPQGSMLLGEYEVKLKAARRATRTAAPALEAEAGAGAGGPRATRALPAVRPGGARPGGGAGAKRPAGAPPPGGAGGAGGPILRGLTGPWANKTWPLKAKLLVGRTPPANVVLEDDSVSRKHAEVEKTPKGVVVRDLGSANGTLVNGEPVEGAVTLQAGDVISFGVVEVALEGEVLNAPVRKERGAGAPGRKGAEAAEGGGGGRKKLIIGVVAGLVLLLGGGGVVMMSSGGGGGGGGDIPAEPIGPVSGGGGESGGGGGSSAQRVQQLLSECRSFASDEMGAQPNWEKALASCKKALDIDPINSEANTLVRRVQVEKEAFDNFTAGQRSMDRLKEEEALDLFRKIPKESMYFRRARPKAREAMEQLQKKALDDCKRYLRDGVYNVAVPRCERYMGYWCQNVTREELEPPLGFTLKLEGRLRKDEWRPKDKLLVQFLVARQKLDPTLAPWKCPVADIFMEDDRPVDPKIAVEAAFKQRFPNKYAYAAMMDYWAGRGNESLVTLQKLRNNYEMSAYHVQADELIRSVGQVHNLYNAGQTFLAEGDVEKAAESFKEVLDVDSKLMVDLTESKPSFYRRSLLADIAAKAYERGRIWADREDFRRACKVWKLGFSFFAGNPTLNRAVGVCSTQGSQALNNAGSCEDLGRVLEFAVKGDGLEERVAAKKTEFQCN
jgi:pSer/pThr/pTyr-binding forkhead associated (FHA) protein/tetratricopeptide (TPR) repeat protein